MKFLHLGDLHIGKSLGKFDLIEDQKYILDQLLYLIEEKGIQAVLIAGDVYDRANPAEAAIGLFDYFLRMLVERNQKVFIISGNHDSDERLNFGRTMFEAKNIYIRAKYDGRAGLQTLEDEHGKLNVYMLPFVKASQVRTHFPDEEIVSYDDAVKTAIKHMQINKEERNIILSHQFVVNGEVNPVLGGSEGAAVQHVGTIEQISCDAFAVFDYAALGHIHSPQNIGRGEVRYAGSPLKYSLNEAGSTKYATIVTLGEKGRVEIELEELKPLRNLRRIRGKLEDLLKNADHPEDYIHVVLTDEERKDNAMGILQTYYPKTLSLEYENSYTRTREEPELSSEHMQEKSFDAIIKEFYRKIYGSEMSGEEWKLMREAAGEAGVVNEAD